MSEALSNAIRKTDIKAVQRLLGDGAQPFVCSKKGTAPIHVAASVGDMRILDALLAAPGLDINVNDASGWTPLLHAVSAYCRDTSIIDRLLTVKTCNIHATDAEGNSALHVAASHAKDDMVGFLVSRGVSSNSCNSFGETALHIAIKEGAEETALLLLQHGADPNTRDGTGSTPLHLSIRQRMLPLTMELIASRRLVPECCIDSQGNTPLHVAAAEGLTLIAAKLEAGGFSADTRNLDGETPRQLAERRAEALRTAELEKIAARQLKGDRRRRLGEEALDSSEVTSFCKIAKLSADSAAVFFRRKYLFVDEAFLDLHDSDLKKLGISTTDRQRFLKAVSVRHANIEKNEKDVARRLYDQKQRRFLLARLTAAAIGVTCVLGLYVILSLVEYKYSG